MEKEQYEDLGCRLSIQMPAEASREWTRGRQAGRCRDKSWENTAPCDGGGGCCSALAGDCHMDMEPPCGQKSQRIPEIQVLW